MKAGKINFFILAFLLVSSSIKAEDKILSAPIVNLEDLKPSYENTDLDNSENEQVETIILKEKNNNPSKSNTVTVNIMGLDKITAKTSEINIMLGETKKFGPLEIKVLKCGKAKSENLNDKVAYLQVKDVSKNQDEKVFIFNGWTFSSDPTIAPFDHAIYDLQLVNCYNI